MIDFWVDFSQADTSYYSIRHTEVSRDIDRDELKKLIEKHIWLDYFSVAVHWKIVHIYIDRVSKEIVVSWKEIIIWKWLLTNCRNGTKELVEKVL